MTVLPPRKCPLGVAFKRQSGLAVPLCCGSWNCPTCAKYLARHWAGVARYGMLQLGVVCYFQTYTLPPYVKSISYAYYKLPSLWDWLRKDVQRHSESFIYLAFVEGQPQRSFMPHFHVLTTTPAPYRIKDFAVHHGFGYEAKEKTITTDGAVDYVSKYASKQGNGAPRGFRRVRCSTKWPKPPRPPRDAYLVQRKRESLADFLVRVSHLTGRDISTLWGNWQVLMGHEEGWDEIAFARSTDL